MLFWLLVFLEANVFCFLFIKDCWLLHLFIDLLLSIFETGAFSIFIVLINFIWLNNFNSFALECFGVWIGDIKILSVTILSSFLFIRFWELFEVLFRKPQSSKHFCSLFWVYKMIRIYNLEAFLCVKILQ